MKKRFLPFSMLLITMVLAQASIVANAAEGQGKYTPRSGSEATISSFMKSIRANQETGLIDPALMIAAQKAVQTTTRNAEMDWSYAGPDNFGGLTRAMLYDKDNNVIIGTMGGDIYKSTNGGITFQRIVNLSRIISSMVMNDNGDIFIGTGEGRDAQLYNGLVDLGYETSFVGNGMYKLPAGATEAEHLSATTPSATNGWEFVNELAYTNGKIYAATIGGVMVSADNGASWTNAQAGSMRSVKANNNGDVLAASETDVYLSKAGGAFQKITGTGDLPANDYPIVIAMSENDERYMYLAYYTYSSSDKVYMLGNTYFTNNNGESWGLAIAGTGLYPIFGTSKNPDMFYGFMTVYPDNPKKLLMGADNLWVLEDKTGLENPIPNSYRPIEISTSGSPSSSVYLHHGIQNIIFSPTLSNRFFVGTNGGVFRGLYKAGYYTYANCNRYFITDDVHSSPSRMMAVAVGGRDKVLGGCLDHGTIRVDRDKNENNMTTGIAIFPNPDEQTNANQQFGYFSKAYAGGPCIISTVDPNIMFVTGTGSLSTPLHRTQTNGEDYDLTNFLGGDDAVVTNEDVFRTPIALYENYHETNSEVIIRTVTTEYDTIDYIVYDSMQYTYDSLGVAIDSLHIHDSVWNIETNYVYGTNIIDLDTLVLSVRDTLAPGDSCYYYSDNAGYPINLILPAVPAELHDTLHQIEPGGAYYWMPKDTIRGLHDEISSVFVAATAEAVYLTRLALVFNKQTLWLKLGTTEGTPTAVALSADGEMTLVGTAEGKLYKYDRLHEIYTSEQVDASDSLNYIYQDVTSFLVAEIGNSQAITSISIDPTNNNHVMVTLGNYGDNNKYVYTATDGKTFTPVAGSNLPACPVYSGIIEKDTKDLIVGTEVGIYRSENNGASWTAAGIVNCPVMDIKQAIVPNHPDKIDVLYDEMGVPTYVVYPGVTNNGVIAAATYGEGILVSDPYAEVSTGDDNNDEVEETVVEHLNVYPNPVRNCAQIDIQLDENSEVSYVIYDLSGRMIVNSELGTYTKGVHTLNINTTNFSKGSYIIRLQTGDKTESTKFLVY